MDSELALWRGPEVFVCFDLETTGLSPKSDRIIEIGAVKFTREQVIDTFSTLVDPGLPVPLVVQRLCGLRDSDLRGQPSPAEAVGELALFSQDCTLVGHGVSFDLAFCSELLPLEFGRRPAIDTSEMARVMMPMARSHSLEQLSRGLGLLHDRPHRALSDAEASRALLLRLWEMGRSLPDAVRGQVVELLRDGVWFSGRVLAAEMAEAAPQRPPGRPVRTVPPVEEAPSPEEPLTDAWVAAQFGERGVLAESREGFELREEQQQMAVAVTQAFVRGRRLLVEAGTGVGKSFAYLFPAREWAARTGEKVVVSTHTINLQEQLATQDLPALERARPLAVGTAVLKGRSNYLSLRRMHRWISATGISRDADELRFKARLLVWVSQTETGDRSELRLAGRDGEFWNQVASLTDDCLGPGCHNWTTSGCFMVRARLQARAAGVIVVNHALLLADGEAGGSALPEFQRLIVDEAHHLEESALQAQVRRLGLASVLLVLDRLPQFPDPDLRQRLKACRSAAQSVFGELRPLLREASQGQGRGSTVAPLVLDRRVLELQDWQRSARGLSRLARTLGLAAAALRTASLAPELHGQLWPQPGNAARECQLAADALQGMEGVVAESLTAAELEPGELPPSRRLSWIESERGDRPVLCSVPTELAEALESRLFGHCDTAVLTSATLATGGSFNYIRSRLGLRDAEELILESPFDYEHQALCCLPVGIPGHDHPEHGAVVSVMAASIASELEGRTLMLFTGYGALREQQVMLRAKLHPQGIAVLAQGLDGTRSQLLKNFRENPRTVLLGTNSFWEGIDLPGTSLQCVIIDKLPFPVPTDPIYRARSQGTRDPFAEIALPEAVLRLKQGFGRLIRGRGDRGAVVICDPRIVDRKYGREFMRALPRATFAYEPATALGSVVGSFLRSPQQPRSGIASGRS